MSALKSWGWKPGVCRDDYRISAPVKGTKKTACYASEPMYIRTRKGEIVYSGVYFKKAKKHCIEIIGEPLSFSGTSRADVEDKVSMWVENVPYHQRRNQEEK